MPALDLRLIWLLPCAAVVALASTEALGPSSRRTSLVFSEIMYHPANRGDGRSQEYIELHNPDPFPRDLSGCRISGSVECLFPPGTEVPGHGFVVVERFQSDLAGLFGLTNVVGSFTNNLPNSSGLVRLLSRSGGVLLEVAYSDRLPWPVAADGAGHSLVLARPSYGEASPSAWRASARVGGSPGGPEPVLESGSLTRVVLNELRAHSGDGQRDFVELFNQGVEAVDLQGVILSNDADRPRFRFPAATVLPGHGFLAVDEDQLGFGLSAVGGKLFLVTSNQTVVMDALSYGGQARGFSLGRFPDGTEEFYPTLEPTPGEANERPFAPQIYINEVRYQPVSAAASAEFVEIKNSGTSKIDLEGWAIDGVGYTFPTHAVIHPGEHLVIRGGSDFHGRLSNDGERLALLRPETVVEMDDVELVWTTNVVPIVVDEVTYGSGSRWGRWTGGGGASLELVDPRSNHRLAANWEGSAMDPGGEWTQVSRTGVADHGVGSADALDVVLLGEGEILIDDVEVIVSGGANALRNPGFDQGMTGWTAMGNHQATVDLATGSTPVLHLRSEGRGDTGHNRVRAELSEVVPGGSLVTLGARVRWLRGRPEVLLRLKGNYLEAAGRLSYREGGTPGRSNSVAREDSGPAIDQVEHWPVLPCEDEPVTVTARVDDPDGISSVSLFFRADPSVSQFRLAMNDAGVDPDVRGGDGIYSARIPGATGGTLVAFHVGAVDGSGFAASFPEGAPLRECLVRFGESSYDNAFGTYRIWMTRETEDRWSAREKLSNAPLDVTFVYDDCRVVYNAGAWYSGSAEASLTYDGPKGALCGYDLELPEDQPVLGATHFVLDGPSSDATAQRQQLSYWFLEQLGLPSNHRRYINLFVNGVGQRARKGAGQWGTIYEDAQQPNSDVLKEWFPDDDGGGLFKADEWLEFGNDGLVERVVANTLELFTNVDGTKKTARYRWNWKPRAAGLEADPFADLFGLVDRLNSDGECYGACLELNVDVGMWMRTFAANDLAANWDSFGNRGAKNTFLYKPERDKWKLLSWDFDVGLGVGGAPTDAPLFQAGDPAIDRMFQEPGLLRLYWRSLGDAIDQFFDLASIVPMLSVRQGWLSDAGTESPDSIVRFIEGRRSFLSEQLAPLAAGFSLLTHDGVDFTTNRNHLVLRGTAPLAASGISINGARYPVTWTSVTHWEVLVALVDGENPLFIAGLDADGVPVGEEQLLTVTLKDPEPIDPAGMVINEILNSPGAVHAEFIELHNPSLTTAYELSSLAGAKIGAAGPDPVRFDVPSGVVIAPGAYVLAVKDHRRFCETYTYSGKVVGEFEGDLFDYFRLAVLPQTLSAGATPGTVARSYSTDGFPWPQVSGGVAMQLIDPRRDAGRPGNWAADLLVKSTPGTVNSVQMELPAFPPVYLNEILLMNATGLVDGRGDRDPWLELFNEGPAPVDLSEFSLLSAVSGEEWRFPSGSSLQPGEFRLVWLDGEPEQSTWSEWHASFRWQGGRVLLMRSVGPRDILIHYLPGELVDVDRSSGRVPFAGYTAVLDVPTPGQTNVYTPPPDPEPILVVVNEWMAGNTRIADPADGDFDDWFELFNPSAVHGVDLSGVAMTDDLASSRPFIVPDGVVLPAGGFLLVWADDEPEQWVPGGDLHVNFKLSKAGDGIFLLGSSGEIIGSAVFGPQVDDISQGFYPDGGSAVPGGSGVVYLMPGPTPGWPNMLSSFPPCPGGGFLSISFPAAFKARVTIVLSEVCEARFGLQCKDELDDPEWLDLPFLQPKVVVLPSGRVEISFEDPNLFGSRQRFYRVTALPFE